MTSWTRSLAHRLRAALPPRARCRLDSWRHAVAPRLGAGAFVHPSVQVLGGASVSIGANSVLSQDCWLNVNHRDGRTTAIEIGHDVFVGRRNFFSSGARIVVHPYVLTANDCQFLGASHRTDDPMRPVITTGTTDADVIEIGANTFVGAGARVLGAVAVGHGCVIGAGSLVTRDVPPFSQAHGVPATVTRRYSVERAAWVPARDFTEADAARLPSADAYLQALRRCGPIEMPHLAAGSDMGHC